MRAQVLQPEETVDAVFEALCVECIPRYLLMKDESLNNGEPTSTTSGSLWPQKRIPSMLWAAAKLSVFEGMSSENFPRGQRQALDLLDALVAKVLLRNLKWGELKPALLAEAYLGAVNYKSVRGEGRCGIFLSKNSETNIMEHVHIPPRMEVLSLPVIASQWPKAFGTQARLNLLAGLGMELGGDGNGDLRLKNTSARNNVLFSFLQRSLQCGTLQVDSQQVALIAKLVRVATASMQSSRTNGPLVDQLLPLLLTHASERTSKMRPRSNREALGLAEGLVTCLNTAAKNANMTSTSNITELLAALLENVAGRVLLMSSRGSNKRNQDVSSDSSTSSRGFCLPKDALLDAWQAAELAIEAGLPADNVPTIGHVQSILREEALMFSDEHQDQSNGELPTSMQLLSRAEELSRLCWAAARLGIIDSSFGSRCGLKSQGETLDDLTSSEADVEDTDARHMKDCPAKELYTATFIRYSEKAAKDARRRVNDCLDLAASLLLETSQKIKMEEKDTVKSSSSRRERLELCWSRLRFAASLLHAGKDWRGWSFSDALESSGKVAHVASSDSLSLLQHQFIAALYAWRVGGVEKLALLRQLNGTMLESHKVLGVVEAPQPSGLQSEVANAVRTAIGGGGVDSNLRDEAGCSLLPIDIVLERADERQSWCQDMLVSQQITMKTISASL
ncbi:unnamed protein product [Amoebophrya sp. A25]|nr:unnamed protein product [Amoebophrya sp. A25]|eukprot:GSA25T00016987001.1